MSVSLILRRLLQALGGLLGLGLAGCDDGTVITRVMIYGDASAYLRLAGSAGLPVEVHGAPFPGISPEDVAARLKAPPAMPAGIRFRAVAPGEAREEARMMLVFNRTDPVDGPSDCRRGGPSAPVAKPGETGFTVTMTICNGNAMEATAHMEARTTRSDDPAEFTRVMRLLMMSLLERPT